MDKNKAKTYPQPYNSLEQFIKDGSRLNQMQLEKELEWAEQNAEDDALPPSDGFQSMLAKLEERGITPKVIEDFEEESQDVFKRGNFWEIRGLLEADAENSIKEEESFAKRDKERKVNRTEKAAFPQILKITGTVAACFAAAAAVFLLKPGIDVVGRRDYQYQSKIRNEDKGDIVWDNQEEYITKLSSLETAYQEIRDKLGITILKLNYVPEDIILSKVTVEDRHARLEFVQEDSFLYVLEVIYPVDDSANRLSDRIDYKEVYNQWMDKWISIQKNQLEGDLVEYNAYFEDGSAYYYLQGILGEDEFIHIVESLSLEAN